MKVGIDFGTTTSTISRLLPDDRLDTQGPIPSIGAWRNGQFFFGNEASELLGGTDVNAFPIRDLKLLLGQSDFRVGPHQVRSEEAAASLLRYLAQRIASREPIEEAVIGTPVHVSLDHRQALVRAAKAAGFASTRLVYEPTSALVGAIDIGKLDPRSVVLVVDWGGGTLDFAVVRKEGNILREIEVDGDVSKLGGSKMDDELARAILDKRPDLRSKVNAIDGGLERLKHEVEGTKIEILKSGFGDESEPHRIVPRWLNEEIEIAPAEVYATIRRLASLAGEQIIKFLTTARISPPDITHLLFAGGVCNSPIVQETISGLFRVAKKIDTMKPQLLTGVGCARLLQRGFSLQLSSAFGVRQGDDSFCALLPAGHDLGVGQFRTADFMMTDVLAAEAIFEFGVRREDGAATGMFSSPGDGFRSLGHLHVRAQEREYQYKAVVPDMIRVHCGVDPCLAVTVYAESQLTQCSASRALTGMPLCVRVGK